jgi:hypothetical protein
MSDARREALQRSGRIQMLALVLAGYQIFEFLWRVLIPENEYPSRGYQIFTMLLDGAFIVVLISWRALLPKWLFWIAVIAGIGLFAIRLTSDASWWTGHLFYTLK